MKKILLPLLLLPFVTSAQVEISALGGRAFSAGTYRNPNDGMKRTSTSPYGSFKIAYLYKSFDFGISADLISIKQSYTQAYYNGKTGETIIADCVLHLYKPGLNASLFANKNFELSKSAVYIGLNVGYIFSFSSGNIYSKELDPFSFDPPPYKVKGASSAITFGMQVGYTYRLSDHLKIRAELMPRYLYSLKTFDRKDTWHRYNTIILPVAVGLSYNL